MHSVGLTARTKAVVPPQTRSNCAQTQEILAIPTHQRRGGGGDDAVSLW